jgi:hypothetical protein
LGKLTKLKQRSLELREKFIHAVSFAFVMLVVGSTVAIAFHEKRLSFRFERAENWVSFFDRFARFVVYRVAFACFFQQTDQLARVPE